MNSDLSFRFPASRVFLCLVGMTHRLNVAIHAALTEAGISIPFPQRDLQVKSLPPDTGLPVLES